MQQSNHRWKQKITVEYVLIRLIYILAIILLLGQTLLLRDETRSFLSRVDKLEGKKITLESLQNDSHWLKDRMTYVHSFINNVLKKN